MLVLKAIELEVNSVMAYASPRTQAYDTSTVACPKRGRVGRGVALKGQMASLILMAAMVMGCGLVLRRLRLISPGRRMVCSKVRLHRRGRLHLQPGAIGGQEQRDDPQQNQGRGSDQDGHSGV